MEEMIEKDDRAYLSGDEASVMNVALPSMSSALEQADTMKLSQERLSVFHAVANVDQKTVSMRQLFTLLKIYISSRGLTKKIAVKYDEKDNSIEMRKRDLFEWRKLQSKNKISRRQKPEDS